MLKKLYGFPIIRCHQYRGTSLFHSRFRAQAQGEGYLRSVGGGGGIEYTGPKQPTPVVKANAGEVAAEKARTEQLDWTGTGTGSYSGTNSRASITMGGPITETAGFPHN